MKLNQRKIILKFIDLMFVSLETMENIYSICHQRHNTALGQKN
jgi:hypothetical protein